MALRAIENRTSIEMARNTEDDAIGRKPLAEDRDLIAVHLSVRKQFQTSVFENTKGNWHSFFYESREVPTLGVLFGIFDLPINRVSLIADLIHRHKLVRSPFCGCLETKLRSGFDLDPLLRPALRTGTCFWQRIR